MQVAVLLPSCGEASRGTVREGLWLGQFSGMAAMTEVIVVHDLRPVLWGWAEWVGLGKGGRASPGLEERLVAIDVVQAIGRLSRT